MYGPVGLGMQVAQAASSPKEKGMWNLIAGLGGDLLGGLLGYKGASKGADANLQAAEMALNWQKEQDRMSRADWAKAIDEYNQRRAMLMRRYGLPVDLMDEGGAPGAAPRGAGLTLGDLAGGGLAGGAGRMGPQRY